MPSRVDLYLLRQMLGPLTLCLSVTMFAQLLERALRIFKDLAAQGADTSFAVSAIVDLAPTYFSLSLAIAFFVAMFIVIARLGDGGEIEALQASGVSIARLSVPFFAIGLVLGLVSLFFLGVFQPYGRYAYRMVMTIAESAGWRAEVRPGSFIQAGPGLVISADRVDSSGHELTGVFIRRLNAKGEEAVATASSGHIDLTGDEKSVVLRLGSGMQLTRPDGAPRVVRFNNIDAVQSLGIPAIRARGWDEWELTLPEIVRRLIPAPPGLTRERLSAELNSRLARSLGTPLLPLLAIPLGMAARRGGRTAGLIVAGVLMLGFHHGMLMATAMAKAGTAPPALTIWSVLVVFAGISLWVFASSLHRPGDTPVSRIVGWIGFLLARLRALFRSQQPRLDVPGAE